MGTIFISYNRASVDAVSSLAEDLASMGHAVWYDQALTGGQRWWDNILEKLRESAIFMPIVTPEALDSQACKLELQYAAALGKPILPLLFSREVNTNFLPKPLGEIQFIDYCAQDKAAALALLRALTGIPAAPPLPEPLPAPPPTPLSYLSDLRERVDVPQLDFQAQIALCYELKDYLQQQGNAALVEVSQLFERFRQRRDLYAKVAREIDSILSVPYTASPAPTPSPEKPTPTAAAKPVRLARTKAPTVVPVASSKAEDDGASSLAMPPTTVFTRTAASTLALILRRALHLAEKWQVTADDSNHLLIDPSACAKSQIGATLTVRDTLFSAKSKELKKAGWEIDEAGVAKSLVTGGALYATSGIAALALLSKTVRDELMSVSAAKTWKRPKLDTETADIADELAEAMQIIAPEAKRYSAVKLDEDVPE